MTDTRSNPARNRRRFGMPAIAAAAVLGVAAGGLLISRNGDGGDDGSSNRAGHAGPATPGVSAPRAPGAASAGPAGETPFEGTPEGVPGAGAVPGTAGGGAPVDTPPRGPAGPGTSRVPGGPDDSVSSPALPPGGAPHTFHPAQDGTSFSRYSVGPDGRELTVWFWSGVCDRHELRAEGETPSSVAVRVVTTGRTAEICTDQAVENTVGLTLATPLGDRDLVDAATGTVVTPQGDPFTAG